MAIDPLMVPYMQRALGGGGISKRDAKGLLSQGASPFASGLMQATQQQRGPVMPDLAKNLGMGQSASAPSTPFFGSSPSTGDAGQMANALASAYEGRNASAATDAGGGMTGGGANGAEGFGKMASMASMAFK